MTKSLTDTVPHMLVGVRGRWETNVIIHDRSGALVSTDGTVAMRIPVSDVPPKKPNYIVKKGAAAPYAPRWGANLKDLFPENPPLDWQWVSLPTLSKVLDRLQVLGATCVRLGANRTVKTGEDTEKKTEVRVLDIEAYNFDVPNDQLRRAVLATQYNPQPLSISGEE